MSLLETVRDDVLSHDFHRACELQLLEAGEGHASTRFRVNDFTANPQGPLHGGILYAMMDVSSFFAVTTKLENGQHPVSVEVNTSVLRAAQKGDYVYIDAKADRVGRTLASIRAEAHVEDASGHRRLIATGTVTKSILSTSRD
jgi:uncharacterized protein (TIGR00369 family)